MSQQLVGWFVGLPVSKPANESAIYLFILAAPSYGQKARVARSPPFIS